MGSSVVPQSSAPRSCSPLARAAQQPLKELHVVFSLKKSSLPAATPRVSKQLFRVALKATF
jgi:hypothetical protein